MTDVTILRGRWVVTGAREDHEVVVDGAVAIEGDTIREVGPWQTMRTAHPEAAVLGSDRVAILPGLINAHHHSAGATATQHGVPDQLLEPWLLSLRRMRPSGVYLNTLPQCRTTSWVRSHQRRRHA